MRNRRSLTRMNARLNGEWASHVRRWLKKNTSHKRRQKSKKLLRVMLEE